MADLTPTEVYEILVRFALANGLRREELGSGWWWGDAIDRDAGIGEAVELLLTNKYGLDLREAIPDEPTEYWG